MDARLTRIKELIIQKEKIDRELETLIGTAEPRRRKCSVCGGEGHQSNACPQRSGSETTSS